MTKIIFPPSISPHSKLANVLAMLLAMTVSAPIAAQSVQDFQLPPNPTPTPSGPVIQGPVDTEAPLPGPSQTAPSQTATPAPATTQNTAPEPRDSRTAAPQVRRSSVPAARPASRTTANPQRQAPVQTTNQNPALPTALPSEASQTGPAFEAGDLASSAAPRPRVETAIGEAAGENNFPWAWLIAFAALVAGLLGFVYWRKQTESAVPATIQPPLAKTASSASGGEQPVPVPAASPDPTPAPTAAPAAATSSDAWVKIESRAVQFQRSMMNATLGYKIVLSNRSGKALEGVEMEADLATAHGKLPVDQQLASPAIALTVREQIARMAPGERLEFSGQILLPLSDVKVIQQGKALHCVPLLRVRVTSADRDPVARTWVVGRKTPEGNRVGRLQPFRFDAPPQTYTTIGERALD